MLSAFALAGLLSFGLPALAVENTVTSGDPVHFQYNTRLIPRFSAGEYDGQMRLVIDANGIVSGTYVPSDGGPRPVTGGVTGDKIWLDFGAGNQWHVTGTIRNGHIVGFSSSTKGLETYTFVANVTGARY